MESEFEMMVCNDGEQQLLFSHLTKTMRVLEFGSGMSTLAIAKRVKRLISIEHNHDYYKRTLKLLQDNNITNVGLFFIPANQEPTGGDDGTEDGFRDYINAPMKNAANGKFDLVFVDGRARVACARKAVEFYLKPGCPLFIHDFGHPDQRYTRPEYEVVRDFLHLDEKEFTMAKFRDKKSVAPGSIPGVITAPSVAKPPEALIPEVKPAPHNNPVELEIVDESTCWYNDYVVDEMNRFYDIHIKDQEITKHMSGYTNLLAWVEPGKKIIDLGCGTAMLSEFCKDHHYTGSDLKLIINGCAKRNFPGYEYIECDLAKESLAWIKKYDVVVLNGVIDIMQYPLNILDAVLQHANDYVIIHRQEITALGETHTIKNGSYGGETYHSIINKTEWETFIHEHGFYIVSTETLNFGNWEGGGNSFLLRRRPLDMKKVAEIAKVCHQTNKAWCEVNGDDSQVDWEDAPEWQKDSMIKGVIFRLRNPDAPEDALHNAWMEDKIKDGWVYGEVKDAEKKTHPCIVPHNELSEVQQKKDYMFADIVDVLKD